MNDKKREEKEKTVRKELASAKSVTEKKEVLEKHLGENHPLFIAMNKGKRRYR